MKETLINRLRKSQSKNPEKAALVVKRNEAWKKVSYSMLLKAAKRVSSILIYYGIKPKDKIAIIGANSPEWVISFFGVMMSGAIAVPLDKELKRNEIMHILEDSEAKALIASSKYIDLIQSVASKEQPIFLMDKIGLPADPKLSLAKKDNIFSFLDVSVEESEPKIELNPGDIVEIIYTSGTTGKSKGVMLTHSNILSNIDALINWMELDENMKVLSVLPIHHVYESTCGILTPLMLGGTIFFAESLKKIGENLKETRPNFFLGVPAIFSKMYERINKDVEKSFFAKLLLSLPLFRKIVQKKIKDKIAGDAIFVSGGSALDPNVAKGLKRFGINIFQGYGITETSPVISVENHNNMRIGSVGFPLPGLQVKIHEPNKDGIGEIWVKGPSVMKGYYKNYKATREVLVNGWYKTGDLGRIDDDGFLYITGRIKNLIVTSKGKNIYPEELEKELLKSPFIEEVMVYGKKIAESEKVCATIYPNFDLIKEYFLEVGLESFSIKEIEKFIVKEVQNICKTLSPFKRIKDIVIREEEFPKTSTRKIKRHEVELI
ncbi:MAG: long-chain fatty acid--CoA ligase [Deltaproteobacteria bacterium]|nr:MAG: long-chain fatty acid--CoA ligase [Deltaproteobacteria bacterium]